MSPNDSASGVPLPIRYITDTDDNGDSFFSGVSSDVNVTIDLGQGAGISMGYFVNGPGLVDMTDQQDLNAYTEAQAGHNFPPAWPPNGGNTLIFVDTPLGASSKLHRMQSLDYTVQILGEIELTLSNGETRLIRPGDVVTQRGTLHRWRNPSATQCSRFVEVNTGALPIKTERRGALSVVA